MTTKPTTRVTKISKAPAFTTTEECEEALKVLFDSNIDVSLMYEDYDDGGKGKGGIEASAYDGRSITALFQLVGHIPAAKIRNAGHTTHSGRLTTGEGELIGSRRGASLSAGSSDASCRITSIPVISDAIESLAKAKGPAFVRMLKEFQKETAAGRG
jgi:hypothetical protein